MRLEDGAAARVDLVRGKVRVRVRVRVRARARARVRVRVTVLRAGPCTPIILGLTTWAMGGVGVGVSVRSK